MRASPSLRLEHPQKVAPVIPKLVVCTGHLLWFGFGAVLSFAIPFIFSSTFTPPQSVSRP